MQLIQNLINAIPLQRKTIVVYATGRTSTGTLLVGGVWQLWEQEGFPLEMSWLMATSHGMAVDWLEAMADASTAGGLPSLIRHIEQFLSDETMTALKVGFSRVIESGKSFEEIVKEKRANGFN